MSVQPTLVIPAKAGTHTFHRLEITMYAAIFLLAVGPRFRGDDK
jgi:hypothetical protein